MNTANWIGLGMFGLAVLVGVTPVILESIRAFGWIGVAILGVIAYLIVAMILVSR